jgi:hypothetical protein
MCCNNIILSLQPYNFQPNMHVMRILGLISLCILGHIYEVHELWAHVDIHDLKTMYTACECMSQYNYSIIPKFCLIKYSNIVFVLQTTGGCEEPSFLGINRPCLGRLCTAVANNFIHSQALISSFHQWVIIIKYHTTSFMDSNCVLKIYMYN